MTDIIKLEDYRNRPVFTATPNFLISIPDKLTIEAYTYQEAALYLAYLLQEGIVIAPNVNEVVLKIRPRPQSDPPPPPKPKVVPRNPTLLEEIKKFFRF